MADPVVTPASPASPASPGVPATPADAAVQASAEATANAALAEAAKTGVASPPTPATPPAADAPKPVAYDLKVPDGSGLDAAFVERTKALATSLKLDQRGAEALLTARAEDAAQSAQARTDLIAAWQPGGAEWVKRDTAYQAAALKDPILGNGNPEILGVAREKAQQALAKFGDDELRADLEASGWGSKPSVVRLLAKIGRAMGEGSQISGSTGTAERKKSDSERMFPSMYNPDGSPKTSA